MPEIEEVQFDGSTAGAGPAYYHGDIIERPGKPRVWRVTKSHIQSRTKAGRATLEKIEFPNEDELAQVQTWSPLESRWMPKERKPEATESDPSS